MGSEGRELVVEPRALGCADSAQPGGSRWEGAGVVFCDGGGSDRRRSAVKLPVPPHTSARICVRKASLTRDLSAARDLHLSWVDTFAARRNMHPRGKRQVGESTGSAPSALSSPSERVRVARRHL